MDPCMLIDFIISWLLDPVTISNVCIGYSGYGCPASTTEVFLCFPSLCSWIIAVEGVLIWYFGVMLMMGWDKHDP